MHVLAASARTLPSQARSVIQTAGEVSDAPQSSGPPRPSAEPRPA